MVRTRPGVVASACLGLTALAVVGGVVLSWGLKSSYDAILFAVYGVTLTAVGALVLSRLPRHPVGWILCLGGLLDALTAELATGWGLRAVQEGWTGGQVAQWVGLASWCLGALMWVLAFLYTPTGRLPSRRWRVVVWAAVVGTLTYLIGWSLSPSSMDPLTGELNRFAVDWVPSQELTVVGGTLLCLSAGASLASLVVRFRHADRTVRQQLKWVGLAGMLLALLLPVAVAWWSVSSFLRVLSPLVLLAMAMALGAAVLRYRLFDVDLIILRSVAYGCVSILALAVYAVVSVSLGTVVGRSSTWQVAAATLAAAAVLRPAPDVVVLDVRLPPSFTDEGTRAAAALKSTRPDLGVVLLSQHIETAHSVELAGLGGFGYLLKDRVLDVSDFLSAVSRVADGGSALDPQVVAALLNRNARQDSLAQLTEREHEVLRLMAQGMTNTGIAKRLVLSERTVEAHVRRLLLKLDIADIEDANRRVLAVLLHLGVTPASTRHEIRDWRRT